MQAAAIPRPDHELQMVEAMVDCAFELGMAFGQAAQDPVARDRSLDLFDAFLRGSQAVRLGIRLGMALRAGPRLAPALAPAQQRPEQERPEQERLERESAEQERPEPPVERDRELDRDYEPVSLPKFLASLGRIATDATRLDGHVPADLRVGAATLKDLLAQARTLAPATSGPVASTPTAANRIAATPVASILAAPRAGPRAALMGSASAALARPRPARGPGLPRPPPQRSG